MKNLFKPLAFLAFAVTTSSAFAFNCYDLCDYNWYTSASGSIVWHSNDAYTLSSGSNTLKKERHYEPGYGFSAAFGLDLCPFRLELETLFKRNSIDSRLAFLNGELNAQEAVQNPAGSTRDLAFMLNAYYDYPICDCLSVYVGAGAGVSFNRTRFVKSPTEIRSNSSTQFAWQLLAGLSHPVTENVEMFTGYRFFSTSKARNGMGTKSKDIPFSNSIDLGLRYYF